jgi:hypothetical protein
VSPRCIDARRRETLRADSKLRVKSVGRQTAAPLA